MMPTVRGIELVQDGVSWWFVIQSGSGVLWSLCLFVNTVPMNVFTILVMWASGLFLVMSVHRHRSYDYNQTSGNSCSSLKSFMFLVAGYDNVACFKLIAILLGKKY
jgi:hypothetical protein